MLINGSPVQTGTLVIAPGEAGAITILGIGELPVVFRFDEGTGRIEFTKEAMEIYNSDSAAGASLMPTVGPAGQPQLPLRIMMYAIGPKDDVMRVIHYTYG